jgi:hypothetical protein
MMNQKKMADAMGEDYTSEMGRKTRYRSVRILRYPLFLRMEKFPSSRCLIPTGTV